jgi:uncharacterized protein (AIM24 family)
MGVSRRGEELEESSHSKRMSVVKNHQSSFQTNQSINQSLPTPSTTMIEGFELWVPPTPDAYDDGMPIYEIIGTDAQIVQFPVRAGRQVMCFSGAMAYMSDGMTMDVKLGGFKRTFGRVAGGGSLFEITYTNSTGTDGYIGMTPDYPGVIIPINMSKSGKIVALRDSFLCATVGIGEQTTDISAGFNPTNSAGAFCCSGFDFIVQTLENGEWAFIMAMGTVIKKTLQQGEKILVDGDSLLCFESSISVDVRAVGNIAAICCGGEGIFNTELTGPGTIWMQSLSIDKMRRLFPPTVHQAGSGDGGGD